MREGKLAIFFGGTLMLLTAVAHAAGSPPKELYGKSIIITWTEHRSQREFGQADFRDVDVPLSHKIYISTTGRWFGRFAATGRGYEAAREHVGTSGRNFEGGQSQVQFSGRTITMTGFTKGGLGRRITIEFNESFTSCEANIVAAKQAGSDVGAGINIYTGKPLEIRSRTVTSVSCSVRDGNVFAQ
jgi:hypothetical protein